MLCGPTEVNGFAFSQGVLALVQLFKRRLNVFGWLSPVAKLMASATLDSSRTQLRSLGELASMYHTRESTLRHDMLYALQGLCSESFEDIGILMDYSEKWHVVFQRLLRFLLPKAANLHISVDGTFACMEHAAKLVSEIIDLKDSTLQGGHQIVKARTYASVEGHQEDHIWYLPNSANPVQVGDFICLFEGAMNPAVVRVQGDYFEVIIIAASWLELVSPPKSSEIWRQAAIEERGFTPLPFVWDWRDPMKVGRGADHQDLLRVVLGLNQLRSPQEVSLAYLKRVSRISGAISKPFGEFKHLPGLVEEARLQSYEAYNRAHAQTSDSVNEVGLPALPWATLNGYDQLARDIVQDGEDVDVTGYNSRAALSYAAELGNIDLAEFLLDNGAEIARFSRHKLRPASAMGEGRNPLAQQLIYLLDQDDDSQRSLFFLAVGLGETDTIHRLLSYGVNINTGSVDKLPSLREITSRTRVDLVRLIKLAKRKVVHSQGGPRSGATPLSIAIERGSKKMVRFLVEQGANPNYSDDYCRFPPLFHCIRYGREMMVRLLLDLGANPDLRDTRGKSSLHYLVMCLGKLPTAVAAAFARVLLEHGCDVNAADEDGVTPLMGAVHKRALDIVSLLVQEGADVNQCDKKMKTSLAYAVEPAYKKPPLKECIKLLLEHGATFEAAPWFYSTATEEGMTPEQMWPAIWPKTGRDDEKPSCS
jgi:ankyrin repeat protein